MTAPYKINATCHLANEAHAIVIDVVSGDVDVPPALLERLRHSDSHIADAARQEVLAAAATVIATVDPLGLVVDRNLRPTIPAVADAPRKRRGNKRKDDLP